jgi:hypothetical protein
LLWYETELLPYFFLFIPYLPEKSINLKKLFFRWKWGHLAAGASKGHSPIFGVYLAVSVQLIRIATRVTARLDPRMAPHTLLHQLVVLPYFLHRLLTYTMCVRVPDLHSSNPACLLIWGARHRSIKTHSLGCASLPASDSRHLTQIPPNNPLLSYFYIH